MDTSINLQQSAKNGDNDESGYRSVFTNVPVIRRRWRILRFHISRKWLVKSGIFDIACGSRIFSRDCVWNCMPIPKGIITTCCGLARIFIIDWLSHNLWNKIYEVKRKKVLQYQLVLIFTKLTITFCVSQLFLLQTIEERFQTEPFINNT